MKQLPSRKQCQSDDLSTRYVQLIDALNEQYNEYFAEALDEEIALLPPKQQALLAVFAAELPSTLTAEQCAVLPPVLVRVARTVQERSLGEPGLPSLTPHADRTLS